jgi:hypothetical protein
MEAEARPPGADPTGVPATGAPATGAAAAAPTTPPKERIGIFPSWKWVYGTVVVYGVITVLFLLALTRLLDFGATP